MSDENEQDAPKKAPAKKPAAKKAPAKAASDEATAAAPAKAGAAKKPATKKAAASGDGEAPAPKKVAPRKKPAATKDAAAEGAKAAAPAKGGAADKAAAPKPAAPAKTGADKAGRSDTDAPRGRARQRIRPAAEIKGPAITVRQTGSPIRRPQDQAATLQGLGLGRIGRTKRLPDTPAVRGMIAKVAHMVEIIEEA